MRPPDRPLRDRKTRDRALILPVLGAVLLMPPIAGIFGLEAAIGGVPVPVLYVFAVWASLIAGTAFLARHLAPAGDDGEDGGASADNGPEPD